MELLKKSQNSERSELVNTRLLSAICELDEKKKCKSNKIYVFLPTGIRKLFQVSTILLERMC